MATRLRPVDLVELRGLCLAIELGSLGRAAAAMGISQPALSKRMRELELFAGSALLTRSPRGVTPTPAGELLHREARTLLTHADAFEQILDGLRGRHAPVRLAASHTIAEYLLPEPLSEYRERLGHGFALELVAANSAVVRELVRERRADLGLAAAIDGGPGPGLTERPLLEDEVVVAVRADHPWAAHDTIALQQFLTTPTVMRDPSANTRQVLDAALRARGLVAAPPLADGSTQAALAAAMSGAGAAVLSRCAVAGADPHLVARRVQGLALRRTFALVQREDGPVSDEVASLAAHLVACLHNRRLGLPSAIGG